MGAGHCRSRLHLLLANFVAQLMRLQARRKHTRQIPEEREFKSNLTTAPPGRFPGRCVICQVAQLDRGLPRLVSINSSLVRPFVRPLAQGGQIHEQNSQGSLLSDLTSSRIGNQYICFPKLISIRMRRYINFIKLIKPGGLVRA